MDRKIFDWDVYRAHLWKEKFLRVGFEELITATGVIESQIGILKQANLPLAVQLLEMARLELVLCINDISIVELENFCGSLRDSKTIE